MKTWIIRVIVVVFSAATLGYMSVSVNRAVSQQQDKEPKAPGKQMADLQPAQPKLAQPKPAQPKPAQPKPAQPKPAQPKPAQPKGVGSGEAGGCCG